MSDANKSLARKWMEEVWNRGSVGAIDDMMSSRCSVHGLGRDQHPEAFKAFHRAFRDAFPDLRVTVDDVVTENDKVAARWSGTGTHRGNGLGFPATNKVAHFTGMFFLLVENGKFIEGWNNFDQLGMLQQLGVVNLPS